MGILIPCSQVQDVSESSSEIYKFWYQAGKALK